MQQPSRVIVEWTRNKTSDLNKKKRMIEMNSQFTDEQIKAYAAQFREGDAIWSGSKWCEVVNYGRFENIAPNNDDTLNTFIVNWGEDSDFEGCIGGFSNDKTRSYQYRVTTLEDYELQGGEKVVRLGESDDFRTFGKVYETDNGAKYRDDKGILRFPLSSSWGVIPRYEQVKNLGKTTITEKVNEVVTSKMNKEKEDEFRSVELTKNNIENLKEYVHVGTSINSLVDFLKSADCEHAAEELLVSYVKMHNAIEDILRQTKDEDYA